MKILSKVRLWFLLQSCCQFMQDAWFQMLPSKNDFKTVKLVDSSQNKNKEIVDT